MRSLILGCALAMVAVTPGNTVGNGHHVTVSHHTDGCSLYLSVPNPCDPAGWN